MSIPNYVCITCGRGFTSSRSARRHVKNVEKGNGYVVTEAVYRTSLLMGKIPPPIPRKIIRSGTTDIVFEEFTRGFFRRLGERVADRLPEKDEKLFINLVEQRLFDEMKKFVGTS